MQESQERLEVRVALLQQRQDVIWETINGGPNVQWGQSIRGRLHEVEQLSGAARNLEHATRNIQAAQRKRLSTWLQVLIAFCTVVAVITPYVLHFTG